MDYHWASFISYTSSMRICRTLCSWWTVGTFCSLRPQKSERFSYEAFFLANLQKHFAEFLKYYSIFIFVYSTCLLVLVLVRFSWCLFFLQSYSYSWFQDIPHHFFWQNLSIVDLEAAYSSLVNHREKTFDLRWKRFFCSIEQAFFNYLCQHDFFF